MRIEQEPIPSAEEFEQENCNKFDSYSSMMETYLKLHLDRIRYEYSQYQDALYGYSKGSDSISEVNAAHDRFLKLLE